MDPSQTISATYELLQGGEQWAEENGTWKATGTALVYRRNGQLWYAWSALTFRDYRKFDEIRLQDIMREVVIPKEAYCPVFDPILTQADPSTIENVFVKNPQLGSCDWFDIRANQNGLCEAVLHEQAICERLRKSPHPHIAEYFGSRVENGRITGLCFPRFEQTLHRRFNPSSQGKRRVQTRGWLPAEIARCLDPIESAVRHLHDLGLVHNDVNPANIMFDANDNPFLINFGSCQGIGQSLKDVGRTCEWHDEGVQESLPSNDLDAINEIRKRLSDKMVKTFRFKE